MTSGIFDDITRAVVTTLEGGTVSLGAYSLPLLGAFALIGWYWTFGRAMAAGGGQMGDALAAALLYAVNIGVAYWLLVQMRAILYRLEIKLTKSDAEGFGKWLRRHASQMED